MAAFFDESYYLQSKLAQLQKLGETEYTNVLQVKNAILDAGMTVQEHFEKFSLEEQTNPNKYFSTTEYLEAKLADLKAEAATKADWADKTVSDLLVALDNAGYTNAYDHYVQYGWDEGVNPSNAFDTDAYLESKLAELKADAKTKDEWADKTVDDLKDVFKDVGFDPITHYEEYGKSEGVTVTEVPADQQVDPAESTGQSFKLTTGVDTIPGLIGSKGTADTSGDDTIVGTYDGAATSTFNVADVIDSGAGDDTLNITATSDAVGTLPAASVKNVETIKVRNVDGNSTQQVLTVDASNFVGATSFNADRSTDSLEFSNLGTGAAIGVIGNGTVVGAAVTADYATTTDAVTLNIADGTKMTTTGVTVTGTATSATINSTGAANTIGTVDLAIATLTSVTINAATNLKGDFLSQATDQVGTDGAVTVSGAATSVEFTAALDNTIKTIDASGMTAGGVKASLGTGTEDYKGGAGVDTITLAAGVKTATFGAGNDVVTTAAVAATAAGSIDGGEGSDTLAIDATTHVNTAAKRAVYTNFEVLQNDTSTDISASDFSGATSVITNGDGGGFDGLSATQAGDVTVTAAQTGGLTYALKTATGTSDELSVKFGDAKGVAFDIAGVFTVNGFETLNLEANAKAGNADQTTSIASFAADKLTALNLRGSAFTLTNAATTKAVAIDASALTGNGAAIPVGLTMGGDLSVGSSVTGSDFKDVITIGTAGSTYNGGKGDDFFTGDLSDFRSGAVYNTIDAGEGTDTVIIDDGAATALTVIDDDFKGLTNVEKITVTDTTTGTQTLTTGGWFNTNFKAEGVTLTTATTTGDIILSAGTFEGDLTLDATSVGTAANEGDMVITTGSGADSITVDTAVAGGTVNIKTGAGNDTIDATAAAGDDTITGGAGNDTIKLGTGGDDTVVFQTSQSLNGTDSITGFTFGATEDIIDFDFGDGGLTALADLRGNGTVAQERDAGEALDANAGLVISEKDIADVAEAETYVEGLTGEAAGDIFYLLSSKDYDASAEATLYRVDFAAEGDATLTVMGTLEAVTLNGINSDNLADWAAIV